MPKQIQSNSKPNFAKPAGNSGLHTKAGTTQQSSKLATIQSTKKDKGGDDYEDDDYEEDNYDEDEYEEDQEKKPA